MTREGNRIKTRESPHKKSALVASLLGHSSNRPGAFPLQFPKDPVVGPFFPKPNRSEIQGESPMKRIVALASALLMLAATAARAQSFSVLDYLKGQNGSPGEPSGVIAQGRDGDLYTTAAFGGSLAGVAFKVAPGRKLTEFSNSRGTGGLTLGRAGMFYGASYGPANGTVFKLSPSGSLTTLHTFTGPDGATPLAPPIQGADGNFYGTTSAGGSSKACSGGCGTVYRITSSGTFTTLHSFHSSDGANPWDPLVQGTQQFR
jgi:uncharacterized repeat protein (TIGR03803 family)